MGAVDETRKLIQDFLAPELRTLTARVDALEKKIEHRADERHREVMLAITNLANYQSVLERVARLESQTKQ
jgi:hypothetical protein